MALYAFDGTWNENEKLEETTNVVRFADIYKIRSQAVEYREGVGTRFGLVGHIFGGLFGAGGRSRIEEMYEELRKNWMAGDQTIDIIGFSRGAALAVHFANILAHHGLELENGEKIKPGIRFLGVWDIVGSFGVPIDLIIHFHDINLGWNIGEIPSTVKRFYHAMALNERRETFVVTRPKPKGSSTHFEEVWFKGVHSDIGGGNKNLPRSNIALRWMLEKAIESGLPIDAEEVERIKIQTNPPARIRNNLDPQRDAMRHVNATDAFHPTAIAKALNVGDSMTFKVYAKDYYNWSGVQLKKGETYQFDVADDQQWQDASIVCDAAGWSSDALPWYKESVVEHMESLRRVPDANWFELCGSLDDNDDYFRIGNGGEERRYTAGRDAELYAFANDLISKYGNNNGSILVTVTRIS